MAVSTAHPLNWPISMRRACLGTGDLTASRADSGTTCLRNGNSIRRGKFSSPTHQTVACLRFDFNPPLANQLLQPPRLALEPAFFRPGSVQQVVTVPQVMDADARFSPNNSARVSGNWRDEFLLEKLDRFVPVECGAAADSKSCETEYVNDSGPG